MLTPLFINGFHFISAYGKPVFLILAYFDGKRNRFVRLFFKTDRGFALLGIRDSVWEASQAFLLSLTEANPIDDDLNQVMFDC
jgi:hypothetical protein